MTVRSAAVGKPWWGKGRKKRDNPEHRLHKAVADYLALALRPPVFWTSIDHGAGKLSKASAGMAKARGVKAGLPDIMIFEPCEMAAACKVIGIELKAPKGSLSDAQKETQADMMVAGVRCRLARAVDHVEDILRANGIPVHGRVKAARAA